MVTQNPMPKSGTERQESSSKPRTWGEYWDSMTPDVLMEWYNQDERTLKAMEAAVERHKASQKTQGQVSDSSKD